MFKKGLEFHKRITLTNAQRYFAQINTTNISNQNIDFENVEHLTKMKTNWWNFNGPVKALHSMNELRVPFIRDGLAATGKSKIEYMNTSNPLKDLKILEVGCGGGILTEPLARLGADITGLDASVELIELAEAHKSMKKINLNNISYTHDTIEEFSTLNKECFDAVVVSEVLEHIDDKDMFLKACVSTLKSEGSIFVTTISKNFVSWLCGIVIAERVLGILPNNTHDWNKFIQPHETQRLLEINNCHTHKIHGMFYQVWNDSWVWCSRTDVNYALHAVKINQIDDKEAYHEK